MNKLNEKQIQILIDFVRNHPGLYDKRHSNFKKINWKNKVWEEIAADLDCGANDCKAAWRSLRDQFAKCVKDSKERKGQDPEEPKKPYKHFDRLLFLKDSLMPRRNYESSNDMEVFALEDLDEEEWSSNNFKFSHVEPSDMEKEIAISRNKRKQLSLETRTPSAKLIRTVGTSRRFREATSALSFDSYASTPSLISEQDILATEVSEESCDDVLKRSGYGKPSKKKRNNEIKDSLSNLFEKVLFEIREKESNTVDVFFRSVAKTVQSFDLTNLEIATLQSKVMAQVTANITEILNEREKNKKQK